MLLEADSNGAAVKDFAALLASLETQTERERAIRQATMLSMNEAPEEAFKPGLLGQRVLLGEMLREGIPPALFLESPALGERLFYREAVWIVSGHKKSGKSWALAATALDCASAGRPVVYVDMENGHRLFAKRMLLLGASPETIDAHLHYVELPRDLALSRLRDDLEAIADELPGAFVVIDSLRGLMSRLSPPGQQLNPNDHQDIEAVCAPLMDAAKTRGLTVGIIDHAKKTGSDSDEYSTAGAGAKEAAVDAVYFWTKVNPYSKDAEGLVKIAATSDRDGELDFARFYRVGGQGDGPFVFGAADADEVGPMGKTRSAVFAFLADHEGETFTADAVVKAKDGDGSKMVTGKAENIRRALELVAKAEPNVYRDPNPNRRDSWVYSYDAGRDSNPGGLSVGEGA
jgi:hypothetical protein